MARILALLLGGAVVISAILVMRSWSPERQIEAKMEKLLSAASARNWKRAGKLMAADYRDGWGHDREQALALAGEFGRHFLALEVTAAEGALVVVEDATTATWKGNFVYAGRGTAIGEAMFSRARELREDFVFAWRRESWKPWDWALVSVTQPELQLYWTP